MTTKIDVDRIYALDEELLRADVPPHARGFKIASRLMKDAGFIGYRLDHPQFEAYLKAYNDLFPNADKTGQWVGFGIVASMDDVRMVTVPLIYGSPVIHVHELCGFKTHDEYAMWVRGRTEIADKTALAAFDALDFAYGVMDYHKANTANDGSAHLATALANLEEVAKRLPESGSYQTLAQCIHLVAETSMKAVLKNHGVEDRELRGRSLGHNLEKLAARLAVECARVKDDVIIAELVGDFPDYVAERYAPTTRSRLDVVRNGLAAQFIAASCTRRLVPDRDTSGIVESDGVVRDVSWYRD